MADDEDETATEEPENDTEPSDDAGDVPQPDDDGDDDEDGEDEGEDEAKRPKIARKKLIIIAAAAVLALGIIGGGVAFFLMGDGDEAGTATVQLAGPPVFHDLPSVTADLKTGRCRSPYLRIQIVLEMPGDQVPVVQEKETEIMDAVQAQLREHERQDLVGKSGTDKLRQEIRMIVNGMIAPAEISGVLFKEFLLQ